MEGEKKKKKNKKKKNKQNRSATDVTNVNDSGEPTNRDQNHTVEPNKCSDDLANANGGGESTIIDQTHTIQEEHQDPVLKFADTQIEVDSLEEKVRRLQEENNIRLHNEASLESKLLQLENEKDSWLQTQSHLEEEFRNLINVTTTLTSKEASLEEKVEQFLMERSLWLEKENSTKEKIASLNRDVTTLQTQVMELEESRNHLLHENQQLAEITSGLQLQIQNLEKIVASDISSIATKPDVTDISPAPGFEQIVKTSEQVSNVDPGSESKEITDASTVKIDTNIQIRDSRNIDYDINAKGVADVTDSLSEPSERTSPVKAIESFDDVAFRSEGEDGGNIYKKDMSVTLKSPHMNGTEEIVQSPLNENQIAGPALQPLLNDENNNVPITDSPLVGAPFRLISYFTRFVSGADLVKK